MLNNKEYLISLFESDKPLIIYKANQGYYIYTDFSDRKIVTKSNINTFIKKIFSPRKLRNKFFDGYIGFFGYQTCCELIGIKIPKQKNNSFKNSIFYKPQTVIKMNKKIFIKSLVPNFRFLKDLKKNNKKFYYEKNFNVNMSLNQYSTIFKKFTKKIKQGETYQIKICQKYRNKSKIDSVKYFWKLMEVNSSPEAFLIRDKNFSIVSCSPETLFYKDKQKIFTKPIAGTLKKSSQLSKRKAKIFFENNIKENKEHNMIVDMERNDLSKICKSGTVKISKLKYVEEYKDLYHYVSKISGKLKENIKTIDILKAMMPGGSVIGCPKINTLHLLNHLEKDSRNIFTGSFGYIKSNRDMRFNIIIRSLLNYKGINEISVASGIILGSRAKKEYEENHIKAKSLLDIFKV